MGLPMITRILFAQMTGDHELIDRVINETFGVVAHDVMSLVNRYPTEDLPVVVANLILVGNALKGILNESGKSIVEQFVAHTDTICIDMSKLREAAENDKE